ncbi:TPR repeat-containing protein [Ancylobacter novellus DSM 506]|uniref:TPR repeat-containing protein n=1 Tax=Ancylobacter novellus (strain ATCC 8093 / DSM 506 / JCM 20403 / CCM 1077 / IAM 12100 / NBRC 12443 / NCIMB 10456) TaxID=639283 RepID=D7A7D5_ANCN5|nr:tetratricopeptide repeat protein [Ancylobacter novellus]ADH90366.1 TPR repeat-containing protein [Ancylobacter novellus DSM 506]
MRALFAALIIAVAPLGGFAPQALAQSAAPAAPAQNPGAAPEAAKQTPEKPSPEKPAEAAQEPDRGKRLDALFAALKAAPDKDSAKNIAERIDVALTPSGSDTADLLMSRAALATQAKDYDLAIELLDGVLKVEPNHLEAWNKRATVFYLKQDFSDALNDLRQVVAREPRHYGAWSGIAIICKEIGDEKHALEAARQALAIYPHLDEVEDMEKTLTISVEGRPI